MIFLKSIRPNVIEETMKTDPATSPSKMSHLVLRTRDLPRLKQWYMTVLNATVAFETMPFITFLRYDDEHHRVGITAIPGDAPPPDGVPREGLHHLAFGYEDMHSLLETYDRLKKAGVSPSHAVNHGPTISMYYRDPDGNGVELLVERFDDAAGAQRFLSEHFAVRGPGIDIDLDDLVKRMR